MNSTNDTYQSHCQSQFCTHSVITNKSCVIEMLSMPYNITIDTVKTGSYSCLLPSPFVCYHDIYLGRGEENPKGIVLDYSVCNNDYSYEFLRNNHLGWYIAWLSLGGFVWLGLSVGCVFAFFENYKSQYI